MDQLTRDQLHEIVNQAVTTRDHAHQRWSSDDRLGKERAEALWELAMTLDRYGL